MTTKAQNILVTGASGQLGAEVLKFLKPIYNGKIIAGSRNLEKIAYLKADGVETRGIDFDKKETLEKGFAGVEKLLIISTDSLAVKGERLKQHLNAIEAAKGAGVKHIYYTSLINPETSPIFFAPDHLGTEEALKKSGISYTILRNNWYVENILDDVKAARDSSEVVTATQGGKVSFITREDCAKAAAFALNRDDLVNKTLDITNEVSYSYADIAKLANEKAKIKEIPLESKENFLQTLGLPSFIVELVVTYEKAVSQGELDVKNNFFFELTGTHPKRLEDVI